MTLAIRVENLAKCYRVNHAEERLPYRTLRDTLARVATAPIRRWRAGGHAGVVEQFWALKDVSFDVQPGEVVGIIGRNGAGKSTLLKILSQITKPTSGQVTLRGRVGSLLEVGTGFHPELTGRENVYMNGSILGMSRLEIERKFDEIVDFSGVEKFLDTPVKRYSSGMQVRLAFSVAAFLDPEILIVDEVLAVGDVGFQRKCLGRIKDVSGGGRTVLFVSHNMAAVDTLCDRGVLLDCGEVVAMDATKNIIDLYYNRFCSNGPDKSFDRPSMRRVLQHASLLDEESRDTANLTLGDVFLLQLKLSFEKEIRDPVIGVGIDDMNGYRLLTLHTPLSHKWTHDLKGSCTVRARVSPFPLAPGKYRIKISISAQDEAVEVAENALTFSVNDADAFDEGRGFHAGVCVAPSEWTLMASDVNRLVGTVVHHD